MNKKQMKNISNILTMFNNVMRILIISITTGLLMFMATKLGVTSFSVYFGFSFLAIYLYTTKEEGYD